MIRARARGVIGALAITAGCTPAAPLPASPATVRVTMDEFRYGAPESFPAGRVVIRTRNAGDLNHDLVVIEIPQDLPPLGEQLQSDARRATTTVSILPPQKPGEQTAFALDLEPGRYGMLCFVPGDDGTPHALEGMHREFRVE